MVVPGHVTMKKPITRIISLETKYRKPSVWNGGHIFQRRVDEISLDQPFLIHIYYDLFVEPIPWIRKVRNSIMTCEGA